jgi:hypothetical protein
MTSGFTVSLLSVIALFSRTSSFGKWLCHQLANEEPFTFLTGPKMAGANPAVAIFPMVNARPVANPAFCLVVLLHISNCFKFVKQLHITGKA